MFVVPLAKRTALKAACAVLQASGPLHELAIEGTTALITRLQDCDCPYAFKAWVVDVLDTTIHASDSIGTLLLVAFTFIMQWALEV